MNLVLNDLQLSYSKNSRKTRIVGCKSPTGILQSRFTERQGKEFEKIRKTEDSRHIFRSADATGLGLGWLTQVGRR